MVAVISIVQYQSLPRGFRGVCGGAGVSPPLLGMSVGIILIKHFGFGLAATKDTAVLPGFLPGPHTATDEQLPPASFNQRGFSSLRNTRWQQSTTFCFVLNWHRIIFDVALAFASELMTGKANIAPTRASVEKENTFEVFVMINSKSAIMIDRWRKYG